MADLYKQVECLNTIEHPGRAKMICSRFLGDVKIDRVPVTVRVRCHRCKIVWRVVVHPNGDMFLRQSEDRVPYKTHGAVILEPREANVE